MVVIVITKLFSQIRAQRVVQSSLVMYKLSRLDFVPKGSYTVHTTIFRIKLENFDTSNVDIQIQLYPQYYTAIRLLQQPAEWNTRLTNIRPTFSCRLLWHSYVQMKIGTASPGEGDVCVGENNSEPYCLQCREADGWCININSYCN